MEVLILVGVIIGRDLLYLAEDTSMSAVFTLIGRGAVYFGDECRFTLGELMRIREDIPEYRPAAEMAALE